MTRHIRVDLLISVCLIPEDRTADVCEVDSDLMSTTCLDTTLEERIYRSSRICFESLHPSPFTLHYPVVCHSTLPGLIDTHLGLITSILDPEESGTDSICRLLWHATDDRMIDLLDLMILEIGEQGFKCWFGFGDQDTSTRISVDTMDECRTESETIIFPFEIILYLIDQIGFCRLVIS